MIPQLATLTAEFPTGTAFEDIPDDLQCPICFVGKEDFELVEE